MVELDHMAKKVAFRDSLNSRVHASGGYGGGRRS